jgi:hypothetical protein
VGWVEFIHEICFPPGPLPDDQDQLLWDLVQVFYFAYLDGRINDRIFLAFGMIMQGTPNYPGMGWREVSDLFKDEPRIRGPFAYVFGERYLRKDDKESALRFFQAAAADAAKEPAQALLGRLARAELDRLK